MTTQHQSREAGFTLLEILVALVVLGLLVGGLAQGSRFGMMAVEHTEQTAADTAAFESTERIIRGLISEMAPGHDGGPPPLAGTSGRMSFVSGVTSPGVVALGWDGKARLILRETKTQADAQWDETILLDHIEGLDFAYWDGSWKSVWQGQELPALIRIRLTFPDGDRRHWPDIVARPLRERME